MCFDSHPPTHPRTPHSFTHPDTPITRERPHTLIHTHTHFHMNAYTHVHSHTPPSHTHPRAHPHPPVTLPAHAHAPLSRVLPPVPPQPSAPEASAGPRLGAPCTGTCTRAGCPPILTCVRSARENGSRDDRPRPGGSCLLARGSPERQGHRHTATGAHEGPGTSSGASLGLRDGGQGWVLGLGQDFTSTHPTRGLRAERKCRRSSPDSINGARRAGALHAVLTVSGVGGERRGAGGRRTPADGRGTSLPGQSPGRLISWLLTGKGGIYKGRSPAAGQGPAHILRRRQVFSDFHVLLS